MPHQCVRCGVMHADGSAEILKGCACGGRLFFFVKQKDIEESKRIVSNLSATDKVQMEQDVFELIGLEREENKAVVLDLETIKILKPGKYELDLVHLFKRDPLIIKLEEGKYVIDLPKAFKKENQ